ncbi:hypothetical protein, partial [uncultured Megasphaera sp.]|uniref:hypothetical protein n=1 Tax=uncultured Megasphaera sp. TaxID=165188 RepID=UPI00258CAF22
LTAGRPVRDGPYAQGHWPCIFVASKQSFHLSPGCDSVGDVPKGVPPQLSVLATALRLPLVGT